MKVGRALLLSMAALTAYLGQVPPSAACSAMLKPTELVIQESDAILRARVVSWEPGRGNDWGRVTLRVEDVLKGRFDHPWITVTGRVRHYRAATGRRVPYDQIDCEGRARGCGSCYAYDYKPNGQYLLLVKDGTPYWAPLSPTNEEVSGDRDPWIRWVKNQLRPRSPGPRASLTKRGFKFVGPTICYAFMQAVGMVNDHEVQCFRYGEVG